MKQFFITVAGVVAGLFVFCILGFFLMFALVGSLVASASNKTTTNRPTVLELDLRQGLSDQDQGMSLFSGSKLSVMKVIQTLRYAENDPKVKSILVRLPEGGVSPASADELRLAFRHFRGSGKRIVAHSQGLYPSGFVVSTYELAASAGEVWMQPDSSFQATGVATSELFLKRFFDKYGVKADYEQRYEYKNAVNPYLHDDYTPAHREATLSWVGSVYDTALGQAAFDRKKDLASLKAVIEAGPYSAEQAQEKGLVDKVGQVHEAEETLRVAAGDDAKVVDFLDYAAAVKLKLNQGSGSTIAVIGAEGAIVTGKGGGGSPFSQSSNVYSDDTAQAFYDAIKDDNVKAIVFRVSSPGGSDTASEEILAAMRAAKAAGKPVVVSMGDYAASGGYWISSDASAIVAEPSTLTGSIGVYGGKFVIGDALGRFGLDMRGISIGGQYADAFDTQKEFTPAQHAAFSAWMDHIYDGFIHRVSTGRHIPEARVREIAKGHIWTGAQAKQLGLVDDIGGFYEAVAKAKALAKIPADEDVKFRSYPNERTFFEALSHSMGVSESAIKTMAAAGWVMSDPRAESLLDQMARARMQAKGQGAVLAPESLPKN
jgi:protease-4